MTAMPEIRGRIRGLLTIGSIFLAMTLLAVASATVLAEEVNGVDEGLDSVFQLVDDAGQDVTNTGLEVVVGDEFISADNFHYRVTAVTGRRARVENLGKVDLSRELARVEGAPSIWRALRARLGRLGSLFAMGLDIARPAQGGRGKTVAIYYTHSDESYVPDDGTYSIYANGGIFDVGASLAQALERQGFQVIDDKTPHDPHDAHAYVRSKRTAMQLLNQRNPDAMIDLHRDTTPAESYLNSVGDKVVAQAMLVVGRQNPKMEENLAFAKRIKAAADQRHPGLIRGIFFARGDYNQQLYRRNILIEMGSHRSKKMDAIQGAEFLAEVIPMIMGVGVGEARSPWRVLGWIIVLGILGGAAFLVLSTGSLEEAWAKLLGFFDREFLGPRRGGGGTG